MTKTCLILDLDETLISSVSNSEIEKLKSVLKRDERTDLDTVLKGQHYRWGEKPGEYVTYERPGLQKFLDFAFENFDVYIWTAGGKEYAVTLVKEIIMRVNPGKRDVKNIHFDYHCQQSEKHYRGNLKDLRMFWEKYNLGVCKKDNTFIVDDNSDVAIPNPNNCIVAKPFRVQYPTDAKKDKFLDKLKKQLQKQLKNGGKISSVEINELNGMVIPAK